MTPTLYRQRLSQTMPAYRQAQWAEQTDPALLKALSDSVEAFEAMTPQEQAEVIARQSASLVAGFLSDREAVAEGGRSSAGNQPQPLTPQGFEGGRTREGNQPRWPAYGGFVGQPDTGEKE